MKKWIIFAWDHDHGDEYPMICHGFIVRVVVDSEAEAEDFARQELKRYFGMNPSRYLVRPE